jgi:hypothetical protein
MSRTLLGRSREIIAFGVMYARLDAISLLPNTESYAQEWVSSVSLNSKCALTKLTRTDSSTPCNTDADAQN